MSLSNSIYQTFLSLVKKCIIASYDAYLTFFDQKGVRKGKKTPRFRIGKKGIPMFRKIIIVVLIWIVVFCINVLFTLDWIQFGILCVIALVISGIILLIRTRIREPQPEEYNPKDQEATATIKQVMKIKGTIGGPVNDYVIQGFWGEDINNENRLYIVFRGTDLSWMDWKYNIFPFLPLVKHAHGQGIFRKTGALESQQSLAEVDDKKMEERFEQLHGMIQQQIQQQKAQVFFMNDPYQKLPEYTKGKSRLYVDKLDKREKKLLNKSKIHKAYWWEYSQDIGKIDEETQVVPSKRETTRTQIHKILEQKEYEEIIITGHSLGGALAIICAWDILYNYHSKYQGKIRCITFANPRVGNKSFALTLKILVPDIHRFVYSNDIGAVFMPRIFGFRHAGILYHIGPKIFTIINRVKHHIPNSYRNFILDQKEWSDLQALVIDWEGDNLPLLNMTRFLWRYAW